MINHNSCLRMGSHARYSILAVLAALAAAPVIAQVTLERTIEDRVLALETAVADLDSSVQSGLTRSLTGTVQDNTLARRVADLEIRLDRLVIDLQRVERAADQAMSEATQARREATNAERVARDASMRVR